MNCTQQAGNDEYFDSGLNTGSVMRRMCRAIHMLLVLHSIIVLDQLGHITGTRRTLYLSEGWGCFSMCGG